MSAISLKSITGITSITTPAGVDNQLTLHTNNTTERVKIDVAGNVHINNQLAVAGITSISSHVHIPQGKDIKFGNNYNSPGLFLSYDGSVGRIQAPSTGIFLGGPVVSLKSGNFNERMLEAVHNGAVTLYYDSSTHSTAKLATTATGVTIDGTAVAGGLDISGDIDVDGHTNLDNVNIVGVTTVAGDILPATTATYNLGTNNAGGIGNGRYANAYFSSSVWILDSAAGFMLGSGADTKFYHNGSGTLIDHSGTGALTFRSNNGINFSCSTVGGETAMQIIKDGGIKLYHNFSGTTSSTLRFETTGQGINVIGHSELDNVNISGVTTTGNLYADNLYANSALTINNNSSVSVNLTSTSTSGSSRIFFGDPDSALVGRINYAHNGDFFQFYTAYSERLRITSTGNVGIASAAPEQRLTVAGATDITHHANTVINNNRLQLGFNAPEGYIKAKNSTGSPAANIALYTTDTSGNTNKRMHLSYDGKVGINQAAPRTTLDVNGYVFLGNGQQIQITGSSGAKGLQLIGQDDGTSLIGTMGSSGEHLLFRTASNERMRLLVGGPHLLLGGSASVNEITESSAHAGMVIGGTGFGNAGLAIISSTSGTGRLYFGDSVGGNAARNRGQINYYHSGDYMLFATAGSERLRIVSDGKVGINVTNPQAFLDIGGNTDGDVKASFTRANDPNFRIQFRNESSSNNVGESQGKFGLFYASNSADICGMQFLRGGSTGAGSLTFTTGGTEYLRINSTGQLLLGETSAFDSNTAIQFRKDVSGNEARFIFRNRANNSSSRVQLQLSTLNRAANADTFSGIEKYQNGGMAIYNGENTNQYSNINFFTNGWRSLQLRNGNHSGAWCAEIDAYWGTSNGLRMEVGGPQSGTWQAIDFHTSHTGTQRGYIGVTYGGVSYNSSSDYRMKQDVVDLTSAINRVKSLKPKRFRWKEDLTHTVDGFLAHEAQTVVPESVQGEKDGEQMQVMDNSKLVPLLTAALKEAITEIETLKTKVAALEGS